MEYELLDNFSVVPIGELIKIQDFLIRNLIEQLLFLNLNCIISKMLIHKLNTHSFVEDPSQTFQNLF